MASDTIVVSGGRGLRYHSGVRWAGPQIP